LAELTSRVVSADAKGDNQCARRFQKFAAIKFRSRCRRHFATAWA
jgi:hypothetical protein